MGTFWNHTQSSLDPSGIAGRSFASLSVEFQMNVSPGGFALGKSGLDLDVEPSRRQFTQRLRNELGFQRSSLI